MLLLAGGLDPTGGAGLAADIKTVSAIGMQPSPVATAITVQDSGGIRSWIPVPDGIIADQAAAVFDDGPVIACKTGMLGSTGALEALADVLERRLGRAPLVVDPVLRAGSGASLNTGSLVRGIRDRLLPMAALVTPNLHEAGELTGMEVRDREEMERAAGAMLSTGVGAVLLKGGHLPGAPDDLLATPGGVKWFTGERITFDNVHGTGCTLASACAAFLAAGTSLEDSVMGARVFVRRAISRRFPRLTGMLPGHFPPAVIPLPSGNGTSWYLPPAYCSSCGGTLAGGPGPGGHLQCGSCGAVHYRNPLPAVALLVLMEGKLLLVRRAVEPGLGMLSLPGGFMETGETPVECGARELKEETGLEMIRSSLFAVESDETVYGGIMLTAYLVTSCAGSPSAGDDASGLEWVDPLQVPPLAFGAHDRLAARLAGSLRS